MFIVINVDNKKKGRRSRRKIHSKNIANANSKKIKDFVKEILI